MNQTLPQSAFFLPPLTSENNGVDFLGLRQANLDMMAELIPATNNVTPYIRPFVLLSWIFWKYYDLCSRTGVNEPSNEALRKFRERIEILFTWGARLHDVPNIPGKDADPPNGSTGAVPLTFEAWGRVQSSTSLIAALWYGPASKTVTGLGFLDAFRPGFFRVTAAGSSLAQALDRQLRAEEETYARLIDTLESVTATHDDARKLWKCWSVLTPTRRSRADRHAGAGAHQRTLRGRGQARDRKNALFAGPDSGGERGALFYTLIRTAALNGVEPEAYLRHVIARIGAHPVKRLHDLLPWNIAAPATHSVAA